MSERSAVRHLTEVKAHTLVWEHDYQTAGHVLYQPTNRQYAIVVLGRVRYLSVEQLMAMLSAPDVIEPETA